MKDSKDSRKQNQGKPVNRRDAPATVAQFLIKEAHMLLSDPLSKKVHAPAQGWKTFNKGIRTYTQSTDMSEEMFNLSTLPR